MESKWYELPSVLWSAYLFDCVPGDLGALRLVDRRTKAVVERALDEYLSLIRQRLAISKDFEYIELVKRQVSKHRAQAQTLLLRIQTSGLSILMLHDPSPALQEVAIFLYRLGHPLEEQSRGWAEARWQLANLPIFISQLTEFDGRLGNEAADLLERLGEDIREREGRLLVAFVREYSAAAALLTLEFRGKERRKNEEMRLFAWVSKISSLHMQ